MTPNPLEDAASATELPDLVARLRALALSLEQYALHGPSVVSPEVTISQWVLGKRAVPILLGKMKGHPTIQDGKVGATTELFFYDPEGGLARTFNRWYRLDPDIMRSVGVLQ